MSVQQRRIILRHIDEPGYTADIDCYMKHGGYATLQAAIKRPAADLVQEVVDSGLKGRGGAGFPCGVKWRFISPKNTKPVYLIANADESEPGTFKDRQIIHKDPHSAIEGIILSAYAIQAKQAFIYIRGEFPMGAKILMLAIEEARAKGFVGENICGSGYSCDIVVHRGGGAYVCGEETGLIESLEGKRGYPRIKPPYFPAVLGLYQCPTIVNNIETLTTVRYILEMGGKEYAKIGVPNDAGTHIWGVSGMVQKPGYYEIEAGKATVGQLLNELCGGPLPGRKFKAIIPGGISTKLLRFGEKFKIKDADGNEKEIGVEDIPLSAPGLMACGSSLGSAGMIVMDDSVDMTEVLANTNAFFAHESCGQCTPCRYGSLWIAKISKRICEGQGRLEDVDLLKSLADQVEMRTVCALGDALAWPVQSSVNKFRDEHLAKIQAQLDGKSLEPKQPWSLVK